MTACKACQKQLNANSAFCRYCGTKVAQKIVFEDMLSEDLYRSSDLLRPPEESVPDVLAVVVDLNREKLTNNYIDTASGLIGFTREIGGTWRFLEPGPLLGYELDQPDAANHLAVLTTVPQSLELVIENLLSGDPIPTIVECRFEVQITTPEAMVSYLDDDPQVFTSTDLANILLPEIESSSSHYLGNVLFSNPLSDDRIAAELSDRYRQVMVPILDRLGISIFSEITVNIYQEIWSGDSENAVKDLVASTLARPNELRSQSRHMSTSSLLALYEETSLGFAVRKRAAVFNNVRLNVLSRQFSFSHGKEAFADLVRSFDRENLIRPGHIDDIFNAINGFAEDPAKSNTLLVKRLSLEIEHETTGISLIRRYGLSGERLVLEDQKARTELQSVWEIERNRISLEIDHRRERLNPSSKNELQPRDTSPAPIDADVVERGLEWYARYKDIKREDRVAEADSMVTIQHRQDMLALEREAASVEIKLRQGDAEHKRRLEEIDALSQVGIETLIAVSGPEQGDLLLQLSKTRALQGFTPEKILALQGIHSPLIKDAVREVGTALAINGDHSELLNVVGGPSAIDVNPGPQDVSNLAKSIAESLETVRNNPLISGVHQGYGEATAALLESGLSDHETMTILFSDIKGSTEITDRLGDIAAQDLFKKHNTIVREQVSEFQGYEIKSMGDGFMLAFPSALNGILCAVQIQKMLYGHNSSSEGEPILVRIGLHTGEVIKENEDYFGRNVILASRISSQAKENQILVSSILKEMTASFNQLEFDTPMSVSLKGLPGDTLVYPVNW